MRAAGQMQIAEQISKPEVEMRAAGQMQIAKQISNPDVEMRAAAQIPDQISTPEVETPEQRFASLDAVGRHQLDKQLDVVIENCRRGLYTSELERYELKSAAHDRLEWRIQARKSCRDDLETDDIEELAEAYCEWIRNESAIDDVWYCIFDKECKDAARDSVVIGRVKTNITGLRKKPGLLRSVREDLEQMHPWSRALADLMNDAFNELLSIDGSHSADRMLPVTTQSASSVTSSMQRVQRLFAPNSGNKGKRDKKVVRCKASGLVKGADGKHKQS